MTDVSFTLDEIQGRVTSALDDFKEHDQKLLELCADERTTTHRIACYLQNYFKDWHVDCEYNRRGSEQKTQRGKKVRPDIIVHHPGIRENLLCIEVKKEGEPLADDRIKLKNFSDTAGDYGYQYGLLLVLSLKPPYRIQSEWFRHGNAI